MKPFRFKIHSVIIELTAVKHSTAVLLFLALGLIHSPSALANPLCKNLFDLNTNANENSYNTYIEKNAHFAGANKLMDIAVMGILANIYDLSNDPVTGKLQITKNNINFNQVQQQTYQAVKNAENVNPNLHKNIFEKAFTIETLDKDTVLLRVTSIVDKTDSVVVGAIKHRLQNLYFQMVSWNYRQSGLIENQSRDSMKLLDDVSVYANELKFLNFTLAFNQKVWQIQKKLISSQIKKFNDATSETEKQKIIEKIERVEEPFLPFAGMAEARSFYSLAEPLALRMAGLPEINSVELKRYFKNDLEDTFNILGIESSNEDITLGYKMIYSTIKALPPKTPLEIHAHSAAHVRFYRSMGFQNQGLIKIEKYKDTDVYLLTSTRENAIEKIESILNKHQ